MATSGVYKINQKNTNRVYIGISIANIFDRWKSHLTSLISGTHENLSLQQDFDRYGLSSFTFEILEFLPFATAKNIMPREIYWIQFYRERGECYNISTGNTYSKETENCIFCSNPIFQNYMCQEHLYLARQGLPRKFRRVYP